MLPQEQNNRVADLAKLRLEQDLSFIKEIISETVDGKTFMADENGFLNNPVVLTEREFVSKWLMCFAIGKVGNRNYFNLDQWYDITNGGRAGVTVKSDTGEVIFIVRPLAGVGTTQEDMEVYQRVGSHLSLKRDMPDDVQLSQDILLASQIIKDNTKSEQVRYSDLVPSWFFEKYGIVPTALQNTIYLRDELKLSPDSEVLDIVKDIFTKIELTSKLTQVDYDFISKITCGTFDLSKVEIVDKIDLLPESQSNNEEDEHNPFEC